MATVAERWWASAPGRRRGHFEYEYGGRRGRCCCRLGWLLPLARSLGPLQAAVTAIRLDGVKYHNPSVTRITDNQPEQVDNENCARPVTTGPRAGGPVRGAAPCSLPIGSARPRPRHPDQPQRVYSVRPYRSSRAAFRGLAATPARHDASPDADPGAPSHTWATCPRPRRGRRPRWDPGGSGSCHFQGVGVRQPGVAASTATGSFGPSPPTTQTVQADPSREQPPLIAGQPVLQLLPDAGREEIGVGE